MTMMIVAKTIDVRFERRVAHDVCGRPAILRGRAPLSRNRRRRSRRR
jgi:hypothetical protein